MSKKPKPGKQVPQSTFICAFCGKRPPEVRPSDEHVLKEMLKYLATPGSKLMGDHSYLDPETGEMHFEFNEDKNKNGYQATVEICATCNSKILNDKIEAPFEAVFKEMREGREVTLDPDAVTYMATWGAKTAMTKELLDTQGGRGDRSIPEWQYEWLHDYVRPPSTMLMYFGKAQHTPNAYSHHRRFRVDPQNPEATGHFTMFVIGHFWLIVVGFATEELFDRFKDGVDEFYGQKHLRSLVRFWPPDTDEAGFLNPATPQVFPPGPEAAFSLCEAIKFGPKKISFMQDGEKCYASFAKSTLPPEGPMHVKVNGKMETVFMKKGRPPGTPGPGHPDDLMMFVPGPMPKG